MLSLREGGFRPGSIHGERAHPVSVRPFEHRGEEFEGVPFDAETLGDPHPIPCRAFDLDEASLGFLLGELECVALLEELSQVSIDRISTANDRCGVE